MISGAHVMLFSSDAAADAAFLRDVIALPHVDAGEGFLIFGLPASELAFHEASGNAGKTEVNFIVDDIAKFVAAMQERAIACEPPADRGWGVMSSVTLPSGVKVGVYEARHARPPSASVAVRAAEKAVKQAKKAAKALRATAKAVRKATKKASKAAKKASKKK